MKQIKIQPHNKVSFLRIRSWSAKCLHCNKKLLIVLSVISVAISAKALQSWKNFGGRENEKARRRSGWFSRTADKEKDNYRGSKKSIQCILLGTVPPPSLFLPFSLSHSALLWPDPSLILHFTSISDDFTVVTERWISSFFLQILTGAHAKMAPR